MRVRDKFRQISLKERGEGEWNIRDTKENKERKEKVTLDWNKDRNKGLKRGIGKKKGRERNKEIERDKER